MAFVVTITIVERADGTCGIEPASPIHVPRGTGIMFKNSTDKTVTIFFEPPLPPDSIPLEAGQESDTYFPSAGSYDMAITCWPPTEAGPRLIIDPPQA
jgi:hypothetical protein